MPLRFCSSRRISLPLGGSALATRLLPSKIAAPASMASTEGERMGAAYSKPAGWETRSWCPHGRDGVQLTLDVSDRPPATSRVIALLAALVCLFFVVTLRDVRLRPLLPWAPAPLVPPNTPDRDASLTVTVVDDADRPLPRPRGPVFALL